jgi:WD40 repeat protein
LSNLTANSLVAVGDEEGGIRLLDSAKDDKSGFSKAYLTFRPHMNAIMDLEFSSDDMLLATASGDQTAQVIDMATQKPI